VSSDPRLFGTDGIRGRFGEPPLDRGTVTALAVHLAATLRERGNGAAPRVVLGGDTRESTPEICRWLAAGLEAGGVELRYAGVIPTPGVAYLARDTGAAAGVVVSASHNPFPDNGIKLIDPRGTKWSDEDEMALERRLLADREQEIPDLPPGRPAIDGDLRERYLRHLAATVPGDRPLDGLSVVLDAGNGAASFYGRELFERLGARVTLLHAEPNGRNVNEGCGSTAPEAMAARVAAEGADLGAAFDGDADRCILADERGEVRDGDAILYLWATCLHRRGRLQPPQIVATSMSNLGLERALAAEGIGVVRCNVGDRYVVETMQKEGILLGGEQSGHIVQSELATTGDGLLTAIQMAALRHQAGQPLSAMLAPFRRYPQILLNVKVAKKVDFKNLPAVSAKVRAVEERLGEDGRLVLRYSGTEPLARIMIEGPEQEVIDALAEELAVAIRGELGAL
jgi:phosphoglucosamine mutase